MGVEDEKRQNREALQLLDRSLFFLILLVLSILLSVRVVVLQRRELCLFSAGEQEAAAALERYILKNRCAVSALVVGCLGFFLMTAKNTLKQALAGDDDVACRSGQRNFAASLLVFLATLIRLYDLHAVELERQQLALAEDVLPA